MEGDIHIKIKVKYGSEHHSAADVLIGDFLLFPNPSHIELFHDRLFIASIALEKVKMAFHDLGQARTATVSPL